MKADIAGISKKAFMVIDKDNTYRKKSYYNFFMYKLKEDKPETGILSYHQKPIFKGMVQFERIGIENDGPFEAFKLWKRVGQPDLRNLAKDMFLPEILRSQILEFFNTISPKPSFGSKSILRCDICETVIHA